MSGSVVVNLAGLLPMRRKLDRLSRLQTGRLMEILGSEMESQTRRRISDEKTSPDGEAWDEWTEAYEQRRPQKGGILELEGNLYDSIAYEVGDDAITIGSNMVYALVHQEGDADLGIPARPYLGVSAENLADLGELTIDFLAREFQG